MKTKLSFLLATILLCACGGSSNDSDFYGGVWHGTASLLENNCGKIAEYIYYTHLISVHGDDAVIDNGATAFDGSLNHGAIIASASRSYSHSIEGVADCQETITWRYEQFEKNSAKFVVRTSTVSCQEENRTAQCQAVHVGTANRSQMRQPGPYYPIGVETPAGAVSDTAL